PFALWLRCQNPQIQPVLAEPGALPEHKIAASTAQVIYQQSPIVVVMESGTLPGREDSRNSSSLPCEQKEPGNKLSI
ncbi:MAG: hypothetical protein LBS10_08230, partial [Gracilibacteraceae bacterium]|nr:hypothetical protein [Gracilibacteraceae bacterium]